jgi:GH15 family glucan-1,4-alpha-glucosidase
MNSLGLIKSTLKEVDRRLRVLEDGQPRWEASNQFSVDGRELLMCRFEYARRLETGIRVA